MTTTACGAAGLDEQGGHLRGPVLPAGLEVVQVLQIPEQVGPAPGVQGIGEVPVGEVAVPDDDAPGNQGERRRRRWRPRTGPRCACASGTRCRPGARTASRPRPGPGSRPRAPPGRSSAAPATRSANPLSATSAAARPRMPGHPARRCRHAGHLAQQHRSPAHGDVVPAGKHRAHRAQQAIITTPASQPTTRTAACRTSKISPAPGNICPAMRPGGVSPS